MKYLIKIAAILFASGLLVACSALSGRGLNEANPGNEPVFTDCQIGVGALRLAARCTSLEVYENRTAQQGRKIKLHIAVIPATSRSSAPDPLFFLAGGPGEAATESYAAISGAFARISLKRDIILVDQRGTGQSNPLICEETEEDSQGLAASIQTCLETLGADPRYYTTPIAMDDLDDVREYLGYEQINLYGASYGTRAALVYARQYPDHVRSMILDGVAPVGWLLGPEGSSDAQRALDMIFERCQATPECAEAFPTLESDFEALQNNLTGEPVKLSIADPKSGQSVTTTITAESVALALHSLSYAPETSALIPLLIAQAYAGNMEPLAAYSLQSNAFQSQSINSALYFSVVCSEDVPYYPELLPQIGYLGNLATEELIEVCSFWPRGELPTAYHEAVESNIPTLLLSGEHDPVTPPENGDLAQKTLSNSQHLILPGYGHISILRGCLPHLAREFVETASLDNLDTTCINNLTPLDFFINFNGSAP